MDIGVGLPTTVSGLDGRGLLDWARVAEHRGFSTLAVLDRLVYDSYEPLVALAAAAGATERVALATTILITPYRPSVALLAKQLASIDRVSGGRLVVGVAAGGREDDFIAAGAPYRGRGRRLDEHLDALRAIWRGDGEHPVGPRPARAEPPVLVGGHSEASLHRAARAGQGWIAGAGSATPIADRLEQARRAWAQAGRSDRPRLAALAYFSLGPDARARAEAYLGGYYGFLGPRAVERVLAGTLTDERALREAVTEHEAAGCDELILFPCAADLAALELLAKAVL